MSKSTYVARSDIHGKGLFAAHPIAAGTVIGWLEGRPARRDGRYVLWISSSEAIEVTCELRYINHSDHPNACYYDDLSVVALRDIAAHMGKDFWRLRIGIGHPGAREEVANYVLAPPRNEEAGLITEALERSLVIWPQLLRDDFEGAMLKLHTRD